MRNFIGKVEGNLSAEENFPFDVFNFLSSTGSRDEVHSIHSDLEVIKHID